MTIFMRVMSRRRFMKSQFMFEDSMPVMSERSMPSYIGRRLARAAAPG